MNNTFVVYNIRVIYFICYQIGTQTSNSSLCFSYENKKVYFLIFLILSVLDLTVEFILLLLLQNFDIKKHCCARAIKLQTKILGKYFGRKPIYAATQTTANKQTMKGESRLVFRNHYLERCCISNIPDA